MVPFLAHLLFSIFLTQVALKELQQFIAMVSLREESDEDYALLLEVIAEESRQAGRLEVTACALISLIETDTVRRASGRLAVISRHVVSLLLSLKRYNSFTLPCYNG